MKKLLILLSLCLLCTACGKDSTQQEAELTVYAAASLTEAMDEIIAQYKAVAPEVTVVPTYDSSGTLLSQIKNGGDCALFLSAARKQMDELEDAGALLPGSRVDLLENRVVLAVPEGNPAGIASFGQLAERLGAGDVLLAMGNSDVPVGQYTREILAYYGLDEAALADSGVLTYGSNVKEVTTQVAEGAVDCGVIYATDAASAALTVVDTAGPEMCGRVVYPAAVLADSGVSREAQAFLDYLRTEEAMAVFSAVGFTPADN